MDHYYTFQAGRLAVITTGYELAVIAAILASLLLIAFAWGRRGRSVYRNAHEGVLLEMRRLRGEVAAADKKFAEGVQQAFNEGAKDAHASIRSQVITFLREQANFLEGQS